MPTPQKSDVCCAWTFWGWFCGCCAGSRPIPLTLEQLRVSKGCDEQPAQSCHSRPSGYVWIEQEKLFFPNTETAQSSFLRHSQQICHFWGKFWGLEPSAAVWRTKLTPEFLAGWVPWEGSVAQEGEKWFWLRNLHIKSLSFPTSPSLYLCFSGILDGIPTQQHLQTK